MEYNSVENHEASYTTTTDYQNLPIHESATNEKRNPTSSPVMDIDTMNESEQKNDGEDANYNNSTFYKAITTKCFSYTDFVHCFYQMMKFMRNLIFVAFTDDSGDPHQVLKGFSFTILVGVLIGIFVPNASGSDHHDPNEIPKSHEWYETLHISSILGYTYFVAWSISFYPQIILNYKLKRTDGLSVDFMILNVIGFIAYGTFNCAFFWSDTIQNEYSHYHHGKTNVIQSNDVAFSIHSIVMSSFTLFQIHYYDGFHKRPPNKWTIRFVWTILVLVCFYIIVLLLQTKPNTNKDATIITNDRTSISILFTWMGFLYSLSYLKIAITFMKAFPQLILNYKRKSTIGWNIWGVLLDIFGGVLSLLQLILDCWYISDFSGITGDFVKFLLSVVSIGFDMIYLIQHYILYPDNQSEGKVNGAIVSEQEQNLLENIHSSEIQVPIKSKNNILFV